MPTPNPRSPTANGKSGVFITATPEEEPHRAAMVARVVALVGFINVPIVKFSVDWWNSLHQPASVFRMDGPTIHSSMLWPLLVMGLAYTFLFLALHLTAMRAEIAARKIRQIQIAEIGER